MKNKNDFLLCVLRFQDYLKIYTLSLKSLFSHLSVSYKTTLNTGGVGWTGAALPTFKLRTILSWPLAQSTYIDL